MNPLGVRVQPLHWYKQLCCIFSRSERALNIHYKVAITCYYEYNHCKPSCEHHCIPRDLPPSLQQGVGFGIYKNIGGESLRSALLHGMPCSFSM